MTDLVSLLKRLGFAGPLQSPDLYCQSAGSDGSDGSSAGIHLRWTLLGDLGSRHLPKGDWAGQRSPTDWPDDYVRVFRSAYVQRFPTILDFSRDRPVGIDGAARVWAYVLGAGTAIHVRFPDAARYQAAAAVVAPAADPQAFVAAYGDGVIEVHVQDKLFFRAVILAAGATQASRLEVEGISVAERVSNPDRAVSIRLAFGPDELGAGDGAEDIAIPNPDFEAGPFGFETEYALAPGGAPGTFAVVGDARDFSDDLQGTPASGKRFMALRCFGRSRPGAPAEHTAWQVEIGVRKDTVVAVSGQLARLTVEGNADLALEIRYPDAPAIPPQAVPLALPPVTGAWAFVSAQWTPPATGRAFVRVVERDADRITGYGLDQLRATVGGKARGLEIQSENLDGLRFRAGDLSLRGVSIETYEDYLIGASGLGFAGEVGAALPPEQAWNLVGEFALTDRTGEAMARFDGPAGDVDRRWLKFNGTATIRRENYLDRWDRGGGLRDAVKQYLQLSADPDNPAADAQLANDADPGDVLDTSYVDLLNLAASDFHVARMLGLGTIDTGSRAPHPYVHIAIYRAPTGVGRAELAARAYMTIPTARSDHRLPEPADLQPPRFGLYVDNGTPEGRNIMTPDGYAWDGLKRFVNLRLDADEVNPPEPQPFFASPVLFRAIDHTDPVAAGVEHRIEPEPDWRRPEIAHEAHYLDGAQPPVAEARALPVPVRAFDPLLRHEQVESGRHRYAAYGVNWFSRAGPLGREATVDTTIAPANRLLPPAALAAQLVQPENPLILTTAEEQAARAALPGPDRTLVRVRFDHTHVQDAAFRFADAVELLYRSDPPLHVAAGIQSVATHGANPALWALRSKAFTPASTADPGTLPQPDPLPQLTAAERARFAGGILSLSGRTYVIQSVEAPAAPGEGPVFLLIKQREGRPVPNGEGGFVASEALETAFTVPDDGRFLAIENMAEAANWGTPNPLSVRVTLGGPGWSTRTETFVVDGAPHDQDLRGVWGAATVSSRPDAQGNDIGVYDVRFATATLGDHPQAHAPEAVVWHGGVLRLPLAADALAPRKVLEVIDIRHAGTAQPLELTVADPGHPADPVATGAVGAANFYPGYQFYLRADPARGLSERTLLPTADEDQRITWLGAQALDDAQGYRSPVSAPVPILAQSIIEPQQPERPLGPTFATRPDVFARSSYSFAVQCTHRPFALVFYRCNDVRLLNAVYRPATVANIRATLAQLAAADGGDPFLVNRWQNFVGFDYAYPEVDQPDGRFRRYPGAVDYRFPNPDLQGVFDAVHGPGHPANADAFRNAVLGAFVPLTEQPLFWRYLRDAGYLPRPAPQKVRDRNGKLLSPDHPDFDQSPMARQDGANRVRFTDFTLDGASSDLWFYGAREIGSRMALGDFSPVAGPVQLINTLAPAAPALLGTEVRDAEPAMGTPPSVTVRIARSPAAEQVAEYRLYRAEEAAAVLGTRAMVLVDSMAAPDVGPVTLTDRFGDLSDPPWGEPVFYRAVGVRRVTWEALDGTDVVEDVPSHPSAPVLVGLADGAVPDQPLPTATVGAELPDRLENVTLRWDKTVHNGRYRVFRMNGRGNWELLGEVRTNDPRPSFSIGGHLDRAGADGARIHHHFRVVAENASGLLSAMDRFLTL